MSPCTVYLKDLSSHDYSDLCSTEPPKAMLDSKLLSETVMVRAGSDLVLDAAVGGRPDPKASWSKGNKELELCEKYNLQYTPTKAMAIIKFCDRDDTGKYILTVKNVSGTKTAEVNVKVLGKLQPFELYSGSSETFEVKRCLPRAHLLFPRHPWNV